MNLEDIIRAWKSDEQGLEPHLPANPVGRELSEEELLDVFGSIQQCTANAATCVDATCDCTCFPGEPANSAL